MNDITQEYEKAVGIFLASLRQKITVLPTAYDDLVSSDSSRRSIAIASAKLHFQTLPVEVRQAVLSDATASAQRSSKGFVEAILSKGEELSLEDLFPKF